MENVAYYIHAAFVLTTLFTVYIFYKAAHQSKTVLTIITGWLTIQSMISLNGFYTITDTMPPRFLLAIAPPLLFILILFATAKGRSFIDRLNMKALTLLHIVRIPVELVLWWLFVHKTIPQIMTFEGRNPDILSGITAPVVYYFAFVHKKISNKVVLVWNIVCLLLLFNIVITAILAAPTPFQQLAFDQPNTAILYFPFIWLPCCIVPLVLFAHLVAIRRLLIQQ
jgi:hypothetical protein